MKEATIVRENLITREGYNPYCGCIDPHCPNGMPRTTWNKAKEQFTCVCGWVSCFPADFINKYKTKWNK